MPTTIKFAGDDSRLVRTETVEHFKAAVERAAEVLRNDPALTRAVVVEDREGRRHGWQWIGDRIYARNGHEVLR